MDIAIRLRGFQLLISFLGRIGSVLKDLGLKDGIESICIQVTFFTRVIIFALILSNAVLEDFITACFQTYDQNRMNKMNKTENKVENRMNETENS